MSDNTSVMDNRLKVYECTKMEYIEHIKIRNGSLVAYLGIIGVISGGVLSAQAPNLAIFLSFPIISFGIACIIAQHNMAISSISNFCVEELFGKKPPVCIWETSESLRNFNKNAVRFTTIGYLITLTIPSIVSLVLNWSLWNRNELFTYCNLMMAVEILLTFLTLYVVLYSGHWRKKLYASSKLRE